MKINKILAAGVAATLAVTSLSAVASAEEHIKSWPMGYTVKSASANVDLLGYVNKLYEDVEQADQQLLVIELGNKATINGYVAPKCEVKDPKLTVTGLKETGTDAKGNAVYQTVTRDYSLVKFARKETADIDKPDGNEGKWSIAILKDDEPTYKAGEFAPVYFDKITEVKVTYTVDLGSETDKDHWNSNLNGKQATIDVGNVYLYNVKDDNKNGKPEYKTPVATYKEGNANYPTNLALLQAESAKVGTGEEAQNGEYYVMIKKTALTDYTAKKNTYEIKDKKLDKFNGVKIAGGATITIADKKITFPENLENDKSEWTLEYDALGRPVAIIAKVVDANTKIGDLKPGDTYRIDVVLKTWYENPAFQADGVNVKFDSVDKTVKHGETVKLYKTNVEVDGYGVYGTDNTIVAKGKDAADAKSGTIDEDGKEYTAGAVAADDEGKGDGDAENDNLIFVDPTQKVSVADTAAHILAYATVAGGWSPSIFSYVDPSVDVKWDSAVKYPLLRQTTPKNVIMREDVKVLSSTGDHASATLDWKVDGNQSYKGDDKPEGTNPFQFAGLASQFGDFFNKQDNGKVTFKFTAKAASSDDWVIGGVPSTETGLKNALGTSSFGLFVNYDSSTGQLQTPGVVDNEALTVTFDVSEILDDMGGLTKGNVNDIYYGLNNGIDYGNGNIGYYVEEVTFTFDDAPAAVDAQTDDDADDDAAVVVADDDDDDVVADDDDDDIAEDDDIIEDDDDDDDDAGEIIADDDDDDDDVNNEVDYVDADDDANPGTGVGLAVIPAIVAAAAAIVSKKRK